MRPVKWILAGDERDARLQRCLADAEASLLIHSPLRRDLGQNVEGIPVAKSSFTADWSRVVICMALSPAWGTI